MCNVLNRMVEIIVAYKLKFSPTLMTNCYENTALCKQVETVTHPAAIFSMCHYPQLWQQIQLFCLREFLLLDYRTTKISEKLK